MELFKHNNWDGFKNGKIGVNCVNEEDARDFLTYIMQQGVIQWFDREYILLHKTYHHHHKYNTVYYMDGVYLRIVHLDSYYDISGDIKRFFPDMLYDQPTIQEQTQLPLTTPQAMQWLYDNYNENGSGMISTDYNGITHTFKCSELGTLIAPYDGISDVSLFLRPLLWETIPFKANRKLKQMTFANGMKEYITNSISSQHFKSVLTGNPLCVEVLDEDDKLTTAEEIDGLWTLKGVYEND